MTEHKLSHIYPSSHDLEDENAHIRKHPVAFRADHDASGIVPGSVKVWVGKLEADFVSTDRPPDYFEGDGKLIVDHATGVATLPLDAGDGAREHKDS